MKNEPKKNYVPVKITDSQHERLTTIAEQLGGVSMSDALRWCVINAPDPSTKASKRIRRAKQPQEGQAIQ